MCDVTKEGYRLKDGKLIPYNVDIASISIKDINALNNEPGTKWDIFVIQSEVKDISKKIEENHRNLTELIRNSNLDHINACPFNTGGINQIIDKRVFTLADDGLGDAIIKKIDDRLKKRGIQAYRGFKGLIRDFILIMTAVGAFFALLEIIGK